VSALPRCHSLTGALMSSWMFDEYKETPIHSVRVCRCQWGMTTDPFCSHSQPDPQTRGRSSRRRLTPAASNRYTSWCRQRTPRSPFSASVAGFPSPFLAVVDMVSQSLVASLSGSFLQLRSVLRHSRQAKNAKEGGTLEDPASR
jgi:hypothetical protein